MTSEHRLAINKFGYGCKAQTTSNSNSAYEQWLDSQLTLPRATSALSSSAAIAAEYQFRQLKKQLKDDSDNPSIQQQIKAVRQQINHNLKTYINDNIASVVRDESGIRWRLLDFFSNHFSITANNRLMKALAPSFETEAIAPNVLGSFDALLQAVVKHPAMLIYLNNERSIGDNSVLGKRRKKFGINENLAREVLELHTLGVDGPYQQQDVSELAKALTGWSITGSKQSQHGFEFKSNSHEPGSRTLLGKTFAAGGQSQAQAMLSYLASHAKTAEYICQKLVTHFVSDTPNQSLIEQMLVSWRQTNGNLKAVMLTMMSSGLVSDADLKYKTPRDFVLSALRAADIDKTKRLNPLFSLRELGQLPFNAGVPAGYEDTRSHWLSPSGILNRADWSVQFAALWQGKVQDLNLLLAQLFASPLSELSENSVLRAESKKQALTLLLMSPEFQQR